MNSQFNTAEFNQAEFNDIAVADVTYELFLDSGAGFVLVSSGDGDTIPPRMLYPGSSYKFVTTTPDGTAEILFSTPPGVNYDGLSG